MRAHGERNPFHNCTGFDWDDANSSKNWDRHRVTPEEAEEAFFYDPIAWSSDAQKSGKEKRFKLLGRTLTGRGLFIVFTIRGQLIRVISARDMSRRESDAYSKYEERNSSV